MRTVVTHAPHLGPKPNAPKPHVPAPAKYPARRTPTVLELARNFGGAMVEWIGAGMPVVSEAQYAERAAICGGCEFWDGTARRGLGRCDAPGCGCSVFKRFLKTARCVKGKWPDLNLPPAQSR